MSYWKTTMKWDGGLNMPWDHGGREKMCFYLTFVVCVDTFLGWDYAKDPVVFNKTHPPTRVVMALEFCLKW